ncbi:MAG: hypothetical protein JWQ55_3838 [Rhodopila sp.]|nr:hypothetical protein [Rhodopila sp.]
MVWILVFNPPRSAPDRLVVAGFFGTGVRRLAVRAERIIQAANLDAT